MTQTLSGREGHLIGGVLRGCVAVRGDRMTQHPSSAYREACGPDQMQEDDGGALKMEDRNGYIENIDFIMK